MADSNEVIIKQKTCLVDFEPLDYFSEDRKLVYCIGCGLIYHSDCWEAISSKCIRCRGRKANIYDTGFVVNNIWKIKSSSDNIANEANDLNPDFIINEIREV